LQFATDLPDAYAVHANEGEAGVVQDVVVDDETWQIQYLAVQILSKRHSVLIETDGVSEVDWIAKDIYVSLPVSTIVEAPVYHPQEPLTAQRQRDVHAYYRQPHRGP
jgi:sporulation protein YlmC with PRC-barrel domain